MEKKKEKEKTAVCCYAVDGISEARYEPGKATYWVVVR